MPNEPISIIDKTIARYSEPEVVARFANASGPRDCEAFLFKTYIAPGSDILDLGVGAGRTAGILAPIARNYLGVDYSDKMIEAAKRKYPQYRFAVMDAADMSSLASENFDVIVFSFNGLGFLYPDHKREACLRECHRLLRRNGLFIFSLHNSRRLVVRPKFTSHSLLGIIRSLLTVIENNVRQGILSRAFWRGHGYVNMAMTAEGGLLTIFAASTAFIQRELKATGFTFVADCPMSPSVKRWNSRWKYYVFRKTSVSTAA